MTKPVGAILAVEVRLLDGRFHCEPEWPPSPARVFQALVAAAAQGADLPLPERSALTFLEGCPPPRIVAPTAVRGQRVKTWVPNNDLDAKGGDPAAVAGIRTSKHHHPWLFDADVPLLYGWRLPVVDDEASRARQADDVGALVALADGLYQLGRGVDMASARAELLSAEAWARRVALHSGAHLQPSAATTASRGVLLDSPAPGTLASLIARYDAGLARFEWRVEGKKATQVFRQAPKAWFRRVAYDCPPERAVFDLCVPGVQGQLGTTALERVVALVESVRDAVVERLTAALPQRSGEIEAALIGRRPGDRGTSRATARVRLVGLPSIGHPKVDRGIRRLLVEVPHDAPLESGDVFWAFSGLEVINPAGAPLVLVRSPDESMTGHYGIGAAAGSRLWRTVTPVVLPSFGAPGRRSRADDPGDGFENGGAARAREEQEAVRSLRTALRHAGVDVGITRAVVQREPFEGRGARAERFGGGTRFSTSTLRHIEVELDRPVAGPLVLGNGRFLGLGLFAPVPSALGWVAFEIVDGLAPLESVDAGGLARALRRAAMARAQGLIGERNPLPSLVSGHAPDGQPLRTQGRTGHLLFAFDSGRRRLLVVPPHVVDGRQPERHENVPLALVEAALEGFTELRSGSAGRLSLRRQPATSSVDDEPLCVAARRWRTATPYVTTHHHKVDTAADAVREDVTLECARRGLPRPATVRVEAPKRHRERGLEALVELDFAVAVRGPLMLGRTRHHGGGLFEPIA